MLRRLVCSFGRLVCLLLRRLIEFLRRLICLLWRLVRPFGRLGRLLCRLVRLFQRLVALLRRLVGRAGRLRWRLKRPLPLLLWRLGFLIGLHAALPFIACLAPITYALLVPAQAMPCVLFACRRAAERAIQRKHQLCSASNRKAPGDSVPPGASRQKKRASDGGAFLRLKRPGPDGYPDGQRLVLRSRRE